MGANLSITSGGAMERPCMSRCPPHALIKMRAQAMAAAVGAANTRWRMTNDQFSKDPNRVH